MLVTSTIQHQTWKLKSKISSLHSPVNTNTPFFLNIHEVLNSGKRWIFISEENLHLTSKKKKTWNSPQTKLNKGMSWPSKSPTTNTEISILAAEEMLRNWAVSRKCDFTSVQLSGRYTPWTFKFTIHPVWTQKRKRYLLQWQGQQFSGASHFLLLF